MTTALDNAALQAAFSQFKIQYADPGGQAWRDRYLQTVQRIREATEAEWISPTFQRELWEESGVSGIGPGNAVTVAGAYGDAELAKFLQQLRDDGAPEDPAQAAATLQRAYDDILARVRPRHTQKRPRARIIRLLAGLYPRHMTCLMDARRTLQVQALVGATKANTDFVGQNPMIRARLREALGDLSTDDVEQAMFTWFLWESHFSKPESGAVETVGASREAIDIPEFSLLPASSQRRSLFAVQNNVALLVSVVRECEQGISKDDLISLIQQEAPQLSEVSANQVVNQALGGGLGLIRFADGAYYPTERGLELLNAPDPGHVLRAPLVGRVFGMGHLLLRLLKQGPMTQQDAARWLQTLVPTWTTTMPGSYIVLWAKLAGLVQAATVNGRAQISLTEDGEDYALALPEDFEERWRIEDTRGEIGGEEPSEPLSPRASTEPSPAYDTAQIVAEGCFLPQQELDELLLLLERKKNLVLQGPPGTGKTWLARRLAYALVGAKDAARVTALQFQPSLSYEDFVRGWRPYAGRDGQGGLRLTDGIFLESVQAALADPSQKYVLVIEEINRGNPAQIFGELLTLLEADKRKKAEELRLAYPKYPDERVFIPPNLYVIGTMNIADRSLALVDLALRRRFAFRTLEPALNGAWRRWCLDAGAPAEIVDAIQQRLNDLNATISADSRLRSQFCVGHSFVTPPAEGVADWQAWFRSVVETEIAPLLEEYWYDDEPTARSQKAKLLQPL